MAEVSALLRRVGCPLVRLPVRDVADDRLEGRAEFVVGHLQRLGVAVEADHGNAVCEEARAIARPIPTAAPVTTAIGSDELTRAASP